jgi:protein translocase SecG subunit
MICMLLLLFVSLVLIGVILLHRGRGGGLAGALGGMGGASALGTRAGDVFTAITCGVAVVWVLLACLTGAALRWEQSSYFSGREEAAKVPEGGPSLEAGPATKDGATKDGAKKPEGYVSVMVPPTGMAFNGVNPSITGTADLPAFRSDAAMTNVASDMGENIFPLGITEDSSSSDDVFK